MIDLENYQPAYLYLTTAVGMLLLIYYLFVDARKNNNFIYIPYFLGLTSFILITYFISTRPISYYFGDMGNYNKTFIEYSNSNSISYGTDVLFASLMHFYSKFLNAELFFFTCSLLYFIPQYIAYKRIFKSYWTVAFILSTLVITSYGFAVNGIRNGIAAQIFLLAIVTPRKLSWILIAVSIGFHSSMVVPAVAFLTSIRYPKLKPYYYIWLACLLISIIFPGFLIKIQAIIPNDKFQQYSDLQATGELSSQFSKQGYRYDLILYGVIPVITSSYYVFKRNMQNKLYNLVTAIYLLGNSFFILVNEITFPNRFAYLSWFIMIPVLYYPIYKYREPRDNLIFVIVTIFLISINILVNG